MPASRSWTISTWLLLAGYLAVVLVTFTDYGITYDEKWNSQYGYWVLRWYVSGFSEDTALDFWTLPCEGSFFNVVGRLAHHVLPFGEYESLHLLGGLFGVLGVFGAMRLARLLGGPAAGFFTTLLLATMPRYFGHAFANSRDVPLAVTMIFAVWFLAQLLKEWPTPRKSSVVKLGVAIGLSMAIRIASFVLFGYLGVALAAWWLFARPVRDPQAPRGSVRRTASGLGGVALTAWLAMIPWWPKAQVHPLWPIEGFVYTTQQFKYDIPVLFDGESLSNQELPWYYVLKWFTLVLPEALLLGLVVAAAAGLAALRSTWSGGYDARVRLITVGVLVMAVCAPIGYITVFGAVDYDGIRHFLFTVPPLVVLASLGLARVISRASRRVALTLGGLVLAGSVLTAVDMVRLHPYQYVWFNRIVAGGVPAAEGRYDTEYWGASYKEGVEWLVRNYPTAPDSRPRVASCSYSLSTSYYLPEDRFEYIGSYHHGVQVPEGASPPDLFLSIIRWDGHEKHEGRIIHTVERMGVPFLRIVEVAKP